jgi:pimeloyl-ACP methyl ester carboxylesterase
MKKVTSKDGTVIAYDQTGNGPAVILVDGAMCSRQFGPMKTLAPLLSQNFTVFAYDRRGRGDSSDQKPYTVEREIEDIQSLINEAGDSAFVLGMSSGAALVLQAVAKGLNISKVVLYEPPFVADEAGKRPPSDYRERVTELIALDKRSDAVKLFLSVVGAPSPVVFIMSLLPMWSKMKTIAHTLPYDAAIMGNFSSPTQLANSIKIPALVINGEKSPESLRNAAKKLASAIPNAKYSELSGQTHNVSTKVLAPTVIEFFLK